MKVIKETDPKVYEIINSELNRQKNILIAEFKSGKLSAVIEHPVPTFQKMMQIKGDIIEIEAQLQSLLAETNALKQHVIWIDIEVHTQDFLNDLQQRVEAMVNGSHLEVLMLRRARTRCHKGMQAIEELSLNELKPLDVFNKRLDNEEWAGEQLNIKQRMQGMFKVLVNELNTKAEEKKVLEVEVENKL